MNFGPQSRRNYLTNVSVVAGFVVSGCLGLSGRSTESANFEAATAYYDPNCGCCGEHAAYLNAASADINYQQVDVETLEKLKKELGIPAEYWSCHTTVLDSGYVIEGHVPVSIINEVVETEPDTPVIALPGMPSGSPGMPGSKADEWVFYAIHEDGTVSEFARK